MADGTDEWEVGNGAVQGGTGKWERCSACRRDRGVGTRQTGSQVGSRKTGSGSEDGTDVDGLGPEGRRGRGWDRRWGRRWGPEVGPEVGPGLTGSGWAGTDDQRV